MSRPPFPREHGVWAMLAYPFLTAQLLRLRGAWPGGQGDILDGLRLALAAVLAYGAFDAMRRAMRQSRAGAQGPLPESFLRHRHFYWGWAYTAAALLVAWPLFARPELRTLCSVAAIGALALVLNLLVVRYRGEKGLAGEIFGALTLSLAMPAALVLSFEGWRRGFGGFWTLTFIFNAGTVFYVKMIRTALEPDGPGEDFPRQLRSLGSFVLASFAVVAALLLRGLVTWPGALSLLPFWLMVQWGIRNPRQHGDIRGLGYALLMQAALFSLILGLAA